MAVKYKSKISVKPYDVALAQPLDVRTVVESVDDLKSALFIDSKAYNGMVVFVDDEDVNNRSLYVCYNKPEEIEEDLTNVEDVWRKLDADYSVRIVENVDELLTIMFPYQGMMAYVNSESSLYILMTKGVNKAKEIGNWRKISHSSSKPTIDKVGIDKIVCHAYDFVNNRLKPKEIANDGSQTPMKGHPVFIAQHATATCCRGCLSKWHKIPKSKELNDQEVDYVVIERDNSEDPIVLDDEGVTCKIFGIDLSKSVSVKYFYREDITKDATEVENINLDVAGVYYIEYTSSNFLYKNTTLIRTVIVSEVENG